MGRIRSLAGRDAVPANMLFECLPDGKEELLTIGVRAPMAIHNLLEQIMRHPSLSGGRAGVLRWALHYGLMEVAKQLKMDQVASDLQQMMWVSDKRRRKAMQDKFEFELNGLKATIKGYIDKGMLGKAKEEWDDAHFCVNQIGDDYWRKRFQDMLASPEFQELATWKPDPPKPGKPVLVK